jgi:unsaturated rhamnogalacturonyl hydrolase
MDLIHIKDTLRRLVNQTMHLSFTMPDDPTNRGHYRWRRWDWPIGVAFYGVGQAADVLNDEGAILRMKQWIDLKINTIEKVCVNSNAPAATLIRLHERFPNPDYERVMGIFDRYLMDGSSKVESGALEHTVIDRVYAKQVWADTIFMSLLYLAKRGVAEGNETYLQELYRQLEVHNECLFDPVEKLYYHGWNDEEKRHIGVHWGRGNAWMTAGVVEILSLTPEHYPERSSVIHILNRQLEALEKHQDDSGLWHTVINHKETYLESSVSAGVAFGVLKGIRLGYVDRSYEAMAVRALQAVVNLVDSDGNATRGSSGTPVKKDAINYNNVPYEVTPFTHGLFLLALSEGIVCLEKGVI